MKKILALAMVILTAGVARSWALLGLENVKYDGSLEVSGVSANNEVDQKDGQNDHRGGVNNRLRVGVEANVVDDVSARIEFGRTGTQYGKSAGSSQTPGASNTLTDEFDTIKIDNAYLDFHDVFKIFNNIRLGRQYVGNKNDLVWYIGPIGNDNMTVNAIDGLSLNHKCQYMEANLFTGKYKEDDGTAEADNLDKGLGGDVNLSNLDIAIPNVIPGGKITLGAAWGVQSSSAIVSDNKSLKIYRLGVNGGVMENMLTYRAEYLMDDGEDKNGGTALSYDGSALDLGLGFNAKENSAGAFGLSLDYVMGSGDDNINDNKDKSFRDFNALGLNTAGRSYGEIFGKSDLLATSVGGTYSGKNGSLGRGLDTGSQGQGLTMLHIGGHFDPAFLAKTSLTVDYFSFGSSENGDNAQTTNSDYGTELDLALHYTHSNNVSAEVGYAQFAPDHGLVGASPANDDTVTKLFARATVKWGGEEMAK